MPYKDPEKQKAWREANADRTRQYHRDKAREWDAAHPERVKERQTKYRQENREKTNAAVAKWRAENPELVQALHAQRRAQKLAASIEPFSVSEMLELWGANCHICLLPVDLETTRRAGAPGWELGLHIDHVVPLTSGGAHSLANCKPSHGLCNLRKGASLL